MTIPAGDFSASGYPVTPVIEGNLTVADPTGTGKFGIITAGQINAPVSGLAPSGDTTGATDLANITSLLTTYRYVQLGPGLFYINTTLDLNPLGAVTLLGAGTGLTIIQQVTANTPILSVAAQGQRVKGIQFEFKSQQPAGNTNAIGMMFGDVTYGSSFISEFDDLYFYQCQTALVINPALAGHTTAGLFSCWFGTIHILGVSQSAVSLEGNAGGGASNATGCVIDNLYIHNNPAGTDLAVGSYYVLFKDWDEVTIRQLNVEHGVGSGGNLIGFSKVGGATIDDLHIEHIEMGGTQNGLVYCDDSVVMIRALTIRFCTFSESTSGAVLIFEETTGGQFFLEGLWFPTSDGGVITPTMALVDYDSNSTGGYVNISGINQTQTNAYIINNGSLDRSHIQELFEALTVAVPASGSATAAQPFDAIFYWTAGSSTLAISQFGATIATIAAGTTLGVFVPGGTTVAPTYTGAPTLQVRTTGS